MSMYKRSRYLPQEHDSIYSHTRHGEVPGSRTSGVGWPFPSKPVSHRRSCHPKMQGSLDIHEFEKMTISKQPKKHLLPQEYHPNGIREIHGSHHPRKDSHRLSSEEIQMARAIHTKELILQEKLWRVEKKIRLYQRDSAGADAGDDHKSEGENNKRQHLTKTRLPEQHWREPVKSREMLMQERRMEGVKHLRKKHSQWDEDRTRDRHGQEGPRWKKGEIEVGESHHSKMKGNKETRDITVDTQKVGGELDKFRWQYVKKYTREQGDEKHNPNWEEGMVAGMRPHDGTEKAKEREPNKASTGNIGWTRDNKYRERTYKDMYSLDNKQDILQMHQHKTAQRLTTENHRGAEYKMYEESVLPPVSSPSYSSKPQQSEMGLMDSTDASFQLLLCRICNRKFASGRLQKHVQICEKANKSHRQVFNSYINRTKGSAIEEFWKNHSRSKTPEKTNHRRNYKTYTENKHRSRLPAATYK